MLRGIVAVALLLATGCGGGGGGGNSAPPPPTVNVTGRWSGTWQSSNGVDGGSLSLSLTQTDGTVSGTASFTGSPCFSGGSFSGVVSDNRLDGSLTAGGIRVDTDATVTGNQMNGTYNAVEAGACTGDTGTFSATRP